MSFLFLFAATLSAQTVPVKKEAAPVRRSSIRAVATASATIIRLEKVSPLKQELAPNNSVNRPTDRQRSVKNGVPYVEFY